MKSNCGIVAYDEYVGAIGISRQQMSESNGILIYDKFVGKVNGRTNLLSMDTFAKIAQDNGFLLFPMLVPINRIKELEFPYVVCVNKHFQAIDGVWSIRADWPDLVHVLSAQLMPEFVISEEHAKEVRGSRSIRKALRKVESQFRHEVRRGPLGEALQFGAGMIPGIGLPLSAAIGAYTAKQRDQSMLGGAVKGALFGAAGAGTAGALKGVSAGTGAMSGAQSGLSNFSYGLVPQPAAATTAIGNAGSAVGSTLPGEFVVNPSAMSFGSGGGAPIAGFAPAAGGGAASLGTAGAVQQGAGGAAGFMKAYGLPLGLATMGSGFLMKDPKYAPPEPLDPADFAGGVGLTREGQIVSQELQKTANTPYGELYVKMAKPYMDAMMPQIKEQYDELRKQVNQRFSAAGGAYSGEKDKELQRVNENEARTIKDLIGQSALQFANAESALRADLNTKGVELNNAQWSILMGLQGQKAEEAAFQFGIEASKVRDLRAILAKTGSLGIMGSLGITPSVNVA